MGGTITLANETLTAELDAQGAWLLRLQDGAHDLLNPKQSYQLPDGSHKVRGGSHVCLPNFGPGGSSGQPQHGYGRDQLWSVVQQTNTMVHFRLEQGQGKYMTLQSDLTYSLQADGISMELTLCNNGRTALGVSPGFHPYFLTGKDEEQVLIDGTSHQLTQLAEAQFFERAAVNLVANDQRYRLESVGLPVWALWSDRLANYVCIEPTAAGNAFEAGTAAQLAAGEQCVYKFSILTVDN